MNNDVPIEVENDDQIKNLEIEFGESLPSVELM